MFLQEQIKGIIIIRQATPPHPEGELEYNKEFRPSLQQEADFWESEEGRNLLLDAFSIRDTRAYFRRRPALGGAPDPDGWRGREHASHFFFE